MPASERQPPRRRTKRRVRLRSAVGRPLDRRAKCGARWCSTLTLVIDVHESVNWTNLYALNTATTRIRKTGAIVSARKFRRVNAQTF